MDDTDDDSLQQQIADAFAKGIIYAQDDFLQLLHHYSLDELSLVVVTYGNEALAALHDPHRANKRVLEFVGAIHDHLSDDDRVLFTAHLNRALEGFHARNEALLRHLPVIPLTLRHGDVRMATVALLDSGAASCLFDAELAEALGIDHLEEGERPVGTRRRTRRHAASYTSPQSRRAFPRFAHAPARRSGPRPAVTREQRP